MPRMLCAKRKFDGTTLLAHAASNAEGPFLCPECNQEVTLRGVKGREQYFAHKPAFVCPWDVGESEAHRRCKIEIYKALLRDPAVTKPRLEDSLQTARPDVSAHINGAPVAIEVQI